MNLDGLNGQDGKKNKLMIDEDRVSTQNPIAAVLDRKERDSENIQNFTPEEIEVAVGLKNEIAEVYYRRNVYLNYNKKDIVIKINKPRKVDILGESAAAHRKLSKKLEKIGAERRYLKNGNVVYHLPRLSD